MKKNITQKILWYAADFIIWLWKILVYFIKKIKINLARFFTRESLWKNKFRVIFCLLGIMGTLYAILSYQIVFISRDIRKQTPAQRMLLSSLNAGASRANQDTRTVVASNSSSQSASQPQPIMTGKIRKIESDRITLLMSSGKEHAILINGDTRLMPDNIKLENDMIVTVFNHNEGGDAIADRISLVSQPVVK